MEPTPAPRSLRPDDGRLRRGRRSRARIRDAARELFRTRGFDATTLRDIAAAAGMGASSIYRHIQSKEELLVEELADLQREAWLRFRRTDDRERPTGIRVRAFLDAEHALLVGDRDLTTIALRAATHPEARVARRVLALQDQTVGLLTEILLAGRSRGELRREVDPIQAARVVIHATTGARLAWANGQIGPDECRNTLDGAVSLLFQGLEAGPADAGEGAEPA